MNPQYDNATVREEDDLFKFHSCFIKNSRARWTAKTAACNSIRGIVKCFSGATLDFAVTNRVTNKRSDVSHLIYAHAPNA